MSLNKEKILSVALRKSRLSEDSFPNIMKAMDQYACQEMGAFAEWLDNNKWFIYLKYQWMKADTEETATTQELVQQYMNRDK